jgi:catechol 2,3-dioxygenase-like lactoylglutathione lyase family enzyme
MRVASVVLGAPDPRALAALYERLLGWHIAASYGPRPGSPPEDGWVMLRPEDPAAGLSGMAFQHEPDYIAPVWPPVAGEQAMMLHLDIAVDDMDAAMAFAIGAGATLATHQPQERIRVLFDPAGHPFCLFPGPVQL